MNSSRKAAVGSFVGTTVEWYDFFLYGTASALVLPRLFFPSFDPLVGTLLSFATFGVAFIARPVGGIVFGHLGDRIGRRPALVATLVMMGVATGLIGLMPGYATIGVAAPVILVVLRFVQGLAVGGEYGGAVLMTVEHAEQNRRGFYGGWVQLGSPAGYVLANSAFLLITQLPESMLYTWGWRVPFLLSFVLVLVGLYIRLRVEESPAFVAVRQRDEVAASPMVSVIKLHWRRILLLTGAYLGTGVTIYVATVYALSYGSKTVGFSSSQMLTMVLFGQLIAFFLMFGIAKISDRVGIKRLYVIGTIGMAVMAFPWLWLLETGSFWAAFLGYLLVFAPYCASYGTMGVFYASAFESRVSYSGVSLSYQLGSVAGPAFAPLIAAELVRSTGTINSVGWYVVVSCAIAVVCSVALRPVRSESASDDQRDPVTT